MISPPQFIEEIVNCEDGMKQSFLSWIRGRISSESYIEVSGRNSTDDEVTKANLVETVAEIKNRNVVYSLNVSNNNTSKEVFATKLKDLKKVVSFFRP